MSMPTQELRLPTLPPEIWLRILEEFAPVTISPELADGDDSDGDEADELYVEEAADSDDADGGEAGAEGWSSAPAEIFDEEEFLDEDISDRADEILFLWLTCRQVSTLFRSLVDYLFEIRYLKQIQIRFGLGIPADLWHDHYIRRGILNLSFSHFEDDKKSIGVFTYSVPNVNDDDGEDLHHQKVTLASAMTSHTGHGASAVDESRSPSEYPSTESFPLTSPRQGTPPWIVLWEGWYNDTDLPGLQIHFDNYSLSTPISISFRWKDALQFFLREQKMLQDMARARSPILDKGHRDRLHELHETIHEDNESIVRDGPELVKDITCQRLALIRTIIRHGRRRKWRQDTAKSWHVSSFHENNRRRELLRLERRKFRFEKWNERQQTRTQMEFLLSRCRDGNRNGDCTYHERLEDQLQLEWNLEAEVENLSSEEDLNDLTVPTAKKNPRPGGGEKKHFTRSLRNTSGHET